MEKTEKTYLLACLRPIRGPQFKKVWVYMKKIKKSEIYHAEIGRSYKEMNKNWNSKGISKKHFRIWYNKMGNKKFHIEHIGNETNRTFLNEKKLKKNNLKNLKNKDIIGINVINYKNHRYIFEKEFPIFEFQPINSSKRDRENDEEENNKEKKKRKIDDDKYYNCRYCDKVYHNCLILYPCQCKICNHCLYQHKLSSVSIVIKCPICTSIVNDFFPDTSLNYHMKKNPSLFEGEKISEKDKQVISKLEFSSDYIQKLNKREVEFKNNGNQNFSQHCIECSKGLCKDNTIHMLCNSCKNVYVPKNFNSKKEKRQQDCDYCKRVFCSRYFNNKFCKEKLEKLKNSNFIPSFNGNILNEYETQIIIKIIEEQKIPLSEIWNQGLKKLNEKKLGIKDYDENLNSDSRLCEKCLYHIQNAFLYVFRRDYKGNLPEKALYHENNIRINCYYGRECTTQTKNDFHSKKYNHICENTKKIKFY